MNTYYKLRDNKTLYTDYTKEEILSTIDPFDWDTITPWLTKMKYPNFPEYYLMFIKNCAEREQNFSSAFGKYLANMRLLGHRNRSIEEMEEIGRLNLMSHMHWENILYYLQISLFQPNGEWRSMDDIQHEYVQAILQLYKKGQAKYIEDNYLF